MTEAYTSYGYSAFEAEIDNTVQKRIVFAISRANRPKWLSWYVFVEGLASGRQKFNLTNKPQLASDQGWDNVNMFGRLLPGGAAAQFNIRSYINVNQFAESPFSMGSLFLSNNGGIVNASIHIDLDPPISSPAQSADFVLRFNKEKPLLNDIALHRTGLIWLLGSTPFRASAVSAGPVSTPTNGNKTVLERGL